MTTDSLKKTPFYDRHLALNARIVDFGGWAMPVQYSSIIDEHVACRERIALFDTSHMGRFDIRGSGARDALDRLVTRSLKGLTPGQARYGFLCNESGGVIDDTVVYRHPDDTDETHYYMVVNAGTLDGDRAHVLAHLPAGVTLVDVSSETVKFDIQGPKARLPLATMTDYDLKSLKRFCSAEAIVLGEKCLVSRSGYTGEYGFELYCRKAHGLKVWDELLSRGKAQGILPAGLGARDTLRTESCLPLYGHELSLDISPIMAGQEWAVSLDKEFIGSAALKKQASSGTDKKIVAFKLDGRQTARPGAEVLAGGKPAGRVTSGVFCPSLGMAAGLALVESRLSAPGTTLEISTGKKTLPAVVVKKPLYQKDA
ncbi:MAG: glycine cleavage system aminomethyltransferase GcvT [Planctomycetota bacterium]